MVLTVAVLALALRAGWRALLACAARASRWLALVAVLVLAAALGAHLAAVLLLAVVTAICAALGVLLSAIADVVVESGWRVVPCQKVARAW